MARNRLAVRHVFPSSNALGFPDLLTDLCVTEAPADLVPYHAGKPSERDAIHFFLEDYKFQGLWTYPERVCRCVANYGCMAVCEPDFSIWLDMPLAEQIHAVYQRRWCARKWQAYGVTILPILSAGDARTWAFAWDGIPQGSAVALQVQTISDFGWLNDMIDCAVEKLQPTVLCVYGRETDKLKLSVPVAWYKPYTARMRERLKHGKGQKLH